MTQVAIRLDDSSAAALERLVAQTHKTRSQVVRDAVKALDKALLVAQMRRESMEVAADEADQAESRAINEEMRQRRAW